MPPQIFLIAPADADAASFVPQLREVLAQGEASALLVPRGNHAENSYKALLKAIVPVAQEAGCAVLVEGEPGLVRLLGADGLHVSGSRQDLRAAIEALKPDLIVGASAGDTRHDAMDLGEVGPDYLLFGPREGAATEDDHDRAQWWADVMEIPSVFSDPSANPETLTHAGCEFVALSANLWAAPEGPGAAVRAFAQRIAAL